MIHNLIEASYHSKELHELDHFRSSLISRVFDESPDTVQINGPTPNHTIKVK